MKSTAAILGVVVLAVFAQQSHAGKLSTIHDMMSECAEQIACRPYVQCVWSRSEASAVALFGVASR